MEKKHVLIIDDDPLMRRLIGGWVTQLDMEVIYGHDGVEGREMARRFRPDLILLDYRMPTENGIEVATLLKGEVETKAIPIVFMTNEDLSIEAEQGLKDIGVSDYIHKSIAFEDFAVRIKKVLGMG